MQQTYDAIVIGAGPAGSAFARTAAKGGLDVLVIDKRKELGSPVRCGEGLGAHWRGKLKLPLHGGAIAFEMEGAKMFAPNGKSLLMRTPETKGYVLERKIFDKYLAIEAARAGAHVLPKTIANDLILEGGKPAGVKARTFDDEVLEFRAPLVVSAEGMEAKIARQAGFADAVAGLYDVDTCFEYEMANVECEPLIEIWFSNLYAKRGYCVAADTEVIAKNSLKPISEVGVGDEVLTGCGWMPVAETMSRDYDGDVVCITPSMINTRVKLTPEHLVRAWSEKEGERWIPASNLKRAQKRRGGDYVVFPLPKDAAEPKIKVSDYAKGIVDGGKIYPIGRNQFGAEFKYKHGIPETLVLTPELMEFFGYFVSEGNVNSNGLIISNTNKKIIERVTKIGESAFGFKAGFWTSQRALLPDCVQVHFASKILKKLFKVLFGEGCRNKKIPVFFQGLPAELKKAFLVGLYRGDGCKEKSPTDGYDQVTLTTTSKHLAYDLWILLASMNIVAYVGRIKKKDAYKIRVRGNQAKELECVFGEVKTGGNGHNYFVKDGKVFMRVRKLEREHYRGKVYDIESAGSFCPFFMVHNCWIFPKAKDVANVGVGIGGDLNQHPKERLDKFIRNHPERFKNAEIVEVKAGNIWVGAPLREFVKDSFMVIGTAAHQVDPIHGGGMALAMEAGEIAGEVAVKAVRAKDFSKKTLSEYETKWRAAEEEKLLKRLKLRKVLEMFTDEDFDKVFEALGNEDLARVLDGDFKPVVAKVLLKRPSLLKVLKALV